MCRTLFVSMAIAVVGLFAGHRPAAAQAPSVGSVADEEVSAQFQVFMVHAVGSRVKMVWQVRSEESVDGFRIYRRAITESGEIDITGESPLESGSRRFEDTGLRPGVTYQYRVAALNPDEEEISSQVSSVTIPAAGLRLILEPRDSNTSETRIDYSLPVAGPVTIEVYDAHGRPVTTIVQEQLPAGDRSIMWDQTDREGSNVDSGTYFCRLTTTGVVLTRKFILTSIAE